MRADQLFLRMLEDLDRRTTVTDEYEALLAAGRLRLLLLDEAPLVHRVNRYRRNESVFVSTARHRWKKRSWRTAQFSGPSAMLLTRTRF